MNLSSLLGVAMALVVMFGAAFTSTSNWKIFLDAHAILIVIGGTLAASLVSFPLPTVMGMFKVVIQKILGRRSNGLAEVLSEIITLSKNLKANPNHLVEALPKIKHQFLKEAVELIVSGGMEVSEVDEIMRKRAHIMYARHGNESGIFKIIGKFPPAFGLMGTTFGMIGLMQGMGSSDAIKQLGPSMAIGLVATLYGIGITNLILIPMGENLAKMNYDNDIVRLMIIDGVHLLMTKKHPLYVEESLKSYLLPSERKTTKRLAA